MLSNNAWWCAVLPAVVPGVPVAHHGWIRPGLLCSVSPRQIFPGLWWVSKHQCLHGLAHGVPQAPARIAMLVHLRAFQRVIMHLPHL